MITPTKEDCEARALLESLGIKYPSDGHLNILAKYDAALRGQLEGKQLVIAQLENDAVKKDAMIAKLVEALQPFLFVSKEILDKNRIHDVRGNVEIKFFTSLDTIKAVQEALTEAKEVMKYE